MRMDVEDPLNYSMKSERIERIKQKKKASKDYQISRDRR